MTAEDFYNSVKKERSYLPEWEKLSKKKQDKWANLLRIHNSNIEKLSGETYVDSKLT